MLTHAELADIAGRVYRAPWSATVAGDVHDALLPREGEVVVALPGTHPQDALDWLRDFSLWPARVRGLGLVHEGFGRGARAAWLKMAPELPSDRLITFTGHSLGGALALALAGIHAFERPDAPFRVVTFGAPRVGFVLPWLRWRLRASVEAVQYQRAGDIVPDVPTRPYVHGGRLTRLGVSEGEFIANHAIAKYAADLTALHL